MPNQYVDMDDLFEGVFQKLVAPEFGKNLGGTLPLFIQPIPSEKQLEVAAQLDRLSNRLEKKDLRCVTINLYDLCLDILKEDGCLEPILDGEASIDRQDLLVTLDSVLDAEQRIIPKIQDVIDTTQAEFVFVDGVGSVYPFVRSHNILNNISTLTRGCNLILFFPGEYSNMQLHLFGKIFDENFYQARNLDDMV